MSNPEVIELTPALADLLASMGEAVISVDENQRIVLFNRAAEKIFGYAAAEVRGQPLDMLLPEVARDGHRRDPAELGHASEYRRLIGERPEIRGQRKDGSVFPAQATVFKSTSDGKTVLTAVLRDISRQRAAETALRDSENRFSAIFDQAAVGIVLSAPDGRWLRVNHKLCEILGYDEGELTNHRFRSITHADDIDSDLGLLARLRAGEIPFYTEEKRFIRKDGSVAWGFVTVSLVRDPEGKPDYFVTIIENIWRRARMTEALRASEERFQDMVSNVPGVVYQFRLDTEGRPWFPYISPTLFEITGLRPEAVMADASLWIDTIHPEDRAEFEASIERSARSLEPWTWEGRMFRTSGELWWIRGAAVPRRLEDGSTLWNGLVLDVTEHKWAEERLAQAQRMEAVGQLTGGVAHDFNNLLAVIQGNAELIAEEIEGLDRLTAPILRASQRGAELTQRLLAFSRRQPLRPQTIDISELVAGMLDLLARTLEETIEIKTAMAPDLWVASADPGQVENALLNLAINARDAMRNGGKLTIECANVRLGATYVARNPEALAGDYVVLAVSDTGTGMSPEVQAHAFEPFFTTKEVGQGSGLGLSMVYGFAKQSGGHVNIYSEVGRGTTVKLYLPRAAGALKAAAAGASDETPRGRGEMVLVIEDDEEVRALAVRMLEDLGYRVVDVPQTAAALEVLAGGEQVDLVLSDVVLPGGTSGPEFAEQVRTRYPELKFVFMSGYPAEAAKRNGFLGSGNVLLNKPFRKQQLADALRETLAKTDPYDPT
jgi:PAS domain S-box-containing protein